ncbi:MAG: RNA polymerase sigma factor SigZ [Ktedonobacteraceae bacterium]
MPITTEGAWETFHTQIKQFALKYTHDEDIAEDILQDVFIKIHMHIGALRDEKKLQTWLYQIARHAIYDHYRQRKHMIALPDTFDIPEEQEQEDVAQTLLPCITAMVDRLPEPYREAIILTEYEGRTQKELAEYLGISLSGAKSRVQRAREKLKTMLLECCHFELDRRGKVIDYHSRGECCLICSSCDE